MAKSYELCSMYFKTSSTYNCQTYEETVYYRLVESYRDAAGQPRQRTILSLGKDVDNNLPFNEIANKLNGMLSGSQSLFPLEENAEKFTHYVFNRLIKEKKIDLVKKIQSEAKDWETVDLSTLKNEDVRELGAEWMSLQALQELGVDKFLRMRGWEEENVQLALTHIVSRAVYPVSELKTADFIRENSSICELTGYPVKKITKDKLYNISKKLYSEKDGLEKYLSRKTSELFDLQDKIILYDLTNTYFEGRMANSKKAKFGRSKEKRSDCKLLVLALVVNVEGFIKYSTIFEGNIADCQTLGCIVENLRLNTSSSEKKAVVVMDAGIATKENLELLKSKGYDYVCVSRSNITKYKVSNVNPVIVKDHRGREITLQEIEVENGDSEYYLKIESPLKALKESAMQDKFCRRFDEGMRGIEASLHKKGGVKDYGKVCERIGRLKAKYPSANRLYSIEIKKDTKEICTEITWQLQPTVVVEKKEEQGVYFVKTSLKKTENHEDLVWIIYNSIRNIESSFRCLKTDLDLRPVYHKKDEASEAHLHLGLLAYWLVNTVRHRLKQQGIHSEWREIVRVMNTQKVVTTCVENDKNQIVRIRRCSEPRERVGLIYQALSYRQAPFVRKKSVVPKSEKFKNYTTESVGVMSG
ncbi:transposase [Bacteroidia bacterium]|nr:transposase [Bacteroidia bacterium]